MPMLPAHFNKKLAALKIPMIILLVLIASSCVNLYKIFRISTLANFTINSPVNATTDNNDNNNDDNCSMLKEYHRTLENISTSFIYHKSYDDMVNEMIYLSDMPIFMDTSIIILSLAHNSESTISPILNQLDILSCLFKEIYIYIYESNSKDNTLQILNEWSLRNYKCDDRKYSQKFKNISNCNNDNIIKKINGHKPSIHKTIWNDANNTNDKTFENWRATHYDEYKKYYKEKEKKQNEGEQDFFNRVHRLSFYRNITLHKLRNEIAMLKKEHQIDYLFMLDIDVKSLELKNILISFYKLYYDKKQLVINDQNNNNIYPFLSNQNTIMCANGVLHIKYPWYRDFFALIFSNNRFAHKMSNDAVTSLLSSSEFTLVNTCFGGFAIYPWDLVFSYNCHYFFTNDAVSRWPELDRLISAEFAINIENAIYVPICEHTTFHYCLKQNYQKPLYFIHAKEAAFYFDQLPWGYTE